MKKSFGSETYLYPMPVFIIGTYNEDGTPNAMNAAWGGTANSAKIAICVDKGHKTTENFLARKAFTVSFADVDHVVEADYVGIVSAHEEPNKVAKAGLHVTASTLVDAPLFDEFPMALECKVLSYDKETELLIGEIVNVSADESVLDENGDIDPAKLQIITYDPVRHTYMKLGEKVGDAFADGVKLKEK